MNATRIAGSILLSSLLVAGPALAVPGYEIVRVNKDATLAPGAVTSITVTCPVGKQVLGGGSGNNTWTGARVVPVQSMPSPNTSTFNNSNNQWTVGFVNFGTAQITLNLAVYAICASQ